MAMAKTMYLSASARDGMFEGAVQGQGQGAMQQGPWSGRAGEMVIDDPKEPSTRSYVSIGSPPLLVKGTIFQTSTLRSHRTPFNPRRRRPFTSRPFTVSRPLFMPLFVTGVHSGLLVCPRSFV
jgi:hypothetical protein